ncbi:MAG: hypothetical protein ABIC04_01140 [Nanoarchaeota archaeon]
MRGFNCIKCGACCKSLAEVNSSLNSPSNGIIIDFFTGVFQGLGLFEWEKDIFKDHSPRPLKLIYDSKTQSSIVL